MQRIARHHEPRDRILEIFAMLAELASAPSFRGCAFVNASAEGPRADGKVADVCTESRAWLRGLFIDLARDHGARDPEQLGRQLALLYDGATIAASMDRDPSAAREAREMAQALLDAQPVCAKPAPRRRSR
jgi:hypothetical protein